MQGEENLQHIAYVQGSILPQGGKILHGQCPCVRDKFHVWSYVLKWLDFTWGWSLQGEGVLPTGLPPLVLESETHFQFAALELGVLCLELGVLCLELGVLCLD